MLLQAPRCSKAGTAAIPFSSLALICSRYAHLPTYTRITRNRRDRGGSDVGVGRLVARLEGWVGSIPGLGSMHTARPPLFSPPLSLSLSMLRPRAFPLPTPSVASSTSSFSFVYPFLCLFLSLPLVARVILLFVLTISSLRLFLHVEIRQPTNPAAGTETSWWRSK